MRPGGRIHAPLAGDLGVGSWIERRARVSPDRAALIWGARTWSYAELADRIRRLANGLRGLGVGPGDRVAWLGPNHPAFLEALFAVGQLGAILAPVNHRLGVDARASILAETEPIVVIEHGEVEPTPAPSARHRVVVAGDRPGSIGHEALAAESRGEAIDQAVHLDDLFLMPHTSGTTGQPRAVMLTHGNVTWNAVNFLTSVPFRGGDVTIAIAPFFRVGGTGVNILPLLFVGGTVVVPDDPSPGGLLEAMERHAVSVGFGNPDLLDGLARSPRWPSADLSQLRFILTGGAPVPERLIRAFLDRGVPLVQGYGLSEAAPLVLVLDADTALRKIGSAGRPPLLVDIRIVDGHGSDVPPGATGELLVRGPNVMAGYWRRPAESREVLLEGGWLRTGDAAWRDEEGDTWIVDRVAAGFKTAGGTVYPGNVERALMAHPGVADAGVVGIPAPDGGMVGAAFVVRSDGIAVSEDELLAVARARLAAHEVPVSISFLDALPRSAVGKLLREELRRLAG